MESISVSEENATLPTILDTRASADPERLYGVSTSIGDDEKLDLRRITYKDMANAVNRCAHWLDAELGKSSKPRTLAYAGPADYRYLILTMAAAKTGNIALLLAPWNPVVAQIKLLEQSNCNIFLGAEDNPMVQNEVKAITAQRTMEVYKLPSQSELLDGSEAPLYPFSKTLDDVREQDYVILHTSGSTGHPGAITYKYGAIAALRYLDRPEEILPDAPKGRTNIRDVWSNRCHLSLLHPSHMGGVLGLGPFNIYWNMPPILAPTNRPITPDIISKILSEDLCDAAFIPPVHLQALSRNPTHLESVGKVKHVLWVGAAWTSTDTANKIRACTEIQPAYGSTEAGPCVFFLERQDDYDWMHFHPMMGAEFRKFSDDSSDDLRELVLIKDTNLVKAQFIFQNFPLRDMWETKDLFSKHPTRDDLWQFRGRKDDIIVLSNARNIMPNLMEEALAGHTKVKAALLGGSRKPNTFLLIEATEPPESADQKRDLIQEVWPTIVDANETMNTYGRVQKPLILIATKEKPFRRTGKGSIQRRMTFEAYSTELKELYEAVEAA